MELYLLDSNFVRQQLFENYDSLVFTDRFYTAGDIKIVMKDTPSNRALFANKTFVEIADNDEYLWVQSINVSGATIWTKTPNKGNAKICRIETVQRTNTKDSPHKLTVSGYTLLGLARDRVLAGSISGNSSVWLDQSSYIAESICTSAINDGPVS